MAYTLLLDKQSAPLQRLALGRVQLDARDPSVTLQTASSEALFYSLVGKIRCYANGVCLGTLGGRRSVTDRCVQCVRFPAGVDFTVTLTLEGFAADALWVTCDGHVKAPASGRKAKAQDEEMSAVVPRAPYLHWNDTSWHEVGAGTHARTVAEVPTPEGYELFCGETHNIVGGISSWPPHATSEDIEQFSNGKTTWEEAMVFFCEKPGIVNLKGVYTGGAVVNKLVELYNGSAHAMCLGSHSIHAAPDASIIYQWFYVGNALQKQYNRGADDLKAYRK